MTYLKLFLLTLLYSPLAFSFAENVTHGYPACIACHVSPNGGGLLTDYGRSLSKELMSTWGVSDSFSEPFFGAVKNRETVKFGGDIRTIQTYLENNQVDRGELFPMQQNVEVGVKVDNVMFVGTAGLRQGPDRTPDRGTFLSERHYVLWQPSQTAKLRVGKFRQSFGINTPNHNRFIKNLLGFGFFSETYNMEFSQFYETYEVTVGSSLGRIDQPRNPGSEQNLSAHFSYYLNENSRFGGSLLIGESDIKRRSLISLNGIFPLAEHWLGLYELDYEQSHLAASPSDSIDTFVSFLKLGHKPFKGLMWYLLFEHFSIDSTTYNLSHAPGLGIQWLPVPHFNIQVEYTRQVNSSQPGNPNNTGWILFHTYL